MLEPLLPDVWRWTWYSEDKGMNFNGYAVRSPEGLALIDPAYADEALWKAVEALGRPVRIILTNKDHERASDELRRRFKVPVAIHADDAPLLAVPPEEAIEEGRPLLGCLTPFLIRGLKSPGECALLWAGRKILFVGDAVTGHRAGSIGLVKKHQGQASVLKGLLPLLELEFDALLVGDGEPLLTGGKTALRRFLEANG